MEFEKCAGMDTHHFEIKNYVGKRVDHFSTERSFGVGTITKQYWYPENERKCDWSARLEITFDSGEVHVFDANIVFKKSGRYFLNFIN